MYPVKTQTIALGAASAAIADPTTAGVTVVRIISTEPAYIEIGPDPTATTASAYLAANEAEHFTVHPSEKVAALEAATGGIVYVTEMSQ